MARPREYDRDAVIAAAKGVFWRRGYDATGLDVLERATQLSRSSMYLAFGSKRELFEETLDDYRSTFIQSVLGPLETEDATADDAAGFFATLGSLFRGDLGNRGCLLVNAIGELGGRDARMARDGAELYARYRCAFANALGHGTAGNVRDRKVTADRAQVLAVAAMGVWITSRVDPSAAALACDSLVEQIRVWASSPPRRRPGARP